MIQTTSFYVLSLALFWISSLHAQDLSEVESQYTILETAYKIETAKLDSMNALMESNARVIDSEKRRTPVDRNRLAQLMAASVPVSGAIKHQQKIVAQMEQQLDRRRARLLLQYSAAIDSLTETRRRVLNEPDKAALENRIQVLSEKRLFVSPVIKSLSFDPFKIRQIDLESTADSVEFVIYKDYLERALKEIDFRMEEIRKSSKEFSAILSLRLRANEFLEEVREQNSFGNLFTSRSSGTGAFVGSGNNPFQAVSDRAFSVAGLLRQLNDHDRMLSKFQAPSFNSTVTFSIQDYVDLLAHTERELAQYKMFVQQKLK